MPHAQSADACLRQVYGYMGPISEIKKAQFERFSGTTFWRAGGGERLYLFSNVPLKLMFHSILSYMACDVRVLTKKKKKTKPWAGLCWGALWMGAGAMWPPSYTFGLYMKIHENH